MFLADRQILIYRDYSQVRGLIQRVLPAQFICSVVKRICNGRDYLKATLFMLSTLFSENTVKDWPGGK